MGAAGPRQTNVWSWSFYICGVSRGFFVPLDKGDAALCLWQGVSYSPLKTP